MRDAVIVEAVRTPVAKGKPGGRLHGEYPVDLLARTLKTLVERAGIDPAEIDDVVGGVVTQVGDQAVNVTRSAVLAAGFPESVPATTVDRQCGSSQQAAHFAAQGVISGAYDVAIACGLESMSRVPMGSNVLPGSDPFGALLPERYPGGLIGQGIAAERIAARWRLSREELDAFACESHMRAHAAWENGEFDREVAWTGQRDETIRPTTSPDVLAGLKPAYYDPVYEERFPEIDWRVTAGNASPLNDGAAALLLTDEEGLKATGREPLARIAATGVSATDPQYFGLAPVEAVERALAKAGRTFADLDVLELNEAFAAQVLGCVAEWPEFDPSVLNPQGGAIALGHPLGASGARLAGTVAHQLARKGRGTGVATLCIGVGQGLAVVLDR